MNNISRKARKTVSDDLVTISESVHGLQRVISLLSSAETKTEVAEIIVKEGFRVLGAEVGDLSIVHPDGNFTLLAVRGYPKDFSKKWKNIYVEAPLITRDVIDSKKPFFIKNSDTFSKRYKVAHAFLALTKTKSAAIIPLIVKNDVIGIIQFNFKEPHTFQNEDKKFMYTLADQCAQALDRVTAQENLKQSKDQLEVILKNTADGVVVQNSDGKILYINDVGAEFLCITKSWRKKNIYFQDVLEKFDITNEHGKIIDFGQEVSSNLRKTELRNIIKIVNKKNKRTQWISIKSSPTFDTKKNISLIIHTLHDITTVKELDQKKDEFISIASHELKTPLTSMKLFLDIHTKQVNKLNNHAVTRHLERVKEQTDRLHKLISDLFDVSQIQKGKLQFSKEQFRIDMLLKNTVHELQLNVSSHKLEISKIQPVTVYGDKFRIYQVITNLINNAVKYSPEGKKIVVSLIAGNDKVTIRIKDYGIGIPKEHQDRIFDRFYQTSEAREKIYSGLGMGLYIASEIIHRHGGKIWVESTSESISKKESGSTFFFTLPLVQTN